MWINLLLVYTLQQDCASRCSATQYQINECATVYHELFIRLKYRFYIAWLCCTNNCSQKGSVVMPTKSTRSNGVKAAPKLNLGLKPEDHAAIVNILKTLLADEFVLYTKLRNYHWNVTGPQFYPLHELFERQYDELEAVLDDTAERIRQFGAMAPATLTEYQQLARLKEHPGEYPDARTMVQNAVADHEALIRYLRADTELVDDEHEDIGVEDFLTGRLQQHQKMAWLLRAHLEGGAF
jgi:starvation-inducible DNA-binding protein